MHPEQTKEQLTAELEELRFQLEEANDTIHAIRTGMVDAFVVQNGSGHQLYTLKSADQTFRILIEKMREGAITVNKNGIILYCNSSFSKMVGIPLDQIVGKNFDRFIKSYSIEKLHQIILEGSHTDYKAEDVLQSLNGASVPVLLSLTNLDLEDGTALSIICTDITEQKEAQAKALDIANQRKMLAQKDEFIGIASHELKTPLTSLKAYLQMITRYKEETVPEKVQTYVAKAESSILKLQTLVNDLLDVSKIQAGKLYFNQLPIDITQLITSCVENSSYMFPDYRITYHPVEKYVVNGNAERLEQVIMNLINNAVKYSPQNKDIKLELEKIDDQIKISVIDQGIGLSPEQQDKIFERFYRVDDKNFMASGLGMGLFICKEIVKNHNGSMGVTSRLNEGSTFYILLPL